MNLNVDSTPKDLGLSQIEISNLEKQWAAYPNEKHTLFLATTPYDQMAYAVSLMQVDKYTVTARNAEGEIVVMFPRETAIWKVINRQFTKIVDMDGSYLIKVANAMKYKGEGVPTGQYL